VENDNRITLFSLIGKLSGGPPMQKRIHRRTVEWRRIAQYEPVQIDGVALTNGDGSDRQQILRDCHAGMRLVLQRERNNTDNPNAVAVFIQDRQQIGYLAQHVAAWVAPLLDTDRAAFDAEIWSLDRVVADDGRAHIGCTIALTQFGFVLVERFSWALAIAAGARLPAATIRRIAALLTPLLRPSVKRRREPHGP